MEKLDRYLPKRRSFWMPTTGRYKFLERVVTGGGFGFKAGIFFV